MTDIASAELDACSRGMLSVVGQAQLPVEITLFSSPSAPPVHEKAAAIDGWLRALATRSEGRVAYRWVGVTDEATAELARESGLAPFAPVDAGDAVALEDSFLGLVVAYGTAMEPISLAGLEPHQAQFWLANRLRRVLAQAHGHLPRRVAYSLGGALPLDDLALGPAHAGGRAPHDLTEGLTDSYEVEKVSLGDAVHSDTDVLVVTQPDDDVPAPARRVIDDFLMLGGKTVIVIASAADLQRHDALMNTRLEPHGLSELLSPYGISMGRDLVIDQEHNHAIEVLRGDGSRDHIAMPALLVANVDATSGPFFDMQHATLPMASSLILDFKRQPDATLRAIATSAETATRLTAPVPVGPEAELIVEPSAKGSVTVAAELRGTIQSAFSHHSAEGTLFVIASSHMLNNPFAWSGNPAPLPPQMQMMGALGGDRRLMAFAKAYLPQLMMNLVVLRNAIDAGSVPDGLLACNTSITASDGTLPKGEAGKPGSALATGARELIAAAEAAEISALEIRDAAGAVKLQRIDDSWRVVAPLAADAHQQNVTQLIDMLPKLVVGQILAHDHKADDALGFTSPDAVRLIAHAGSDQRLDLHIGTAGARGYPVRLAGSSEVRLLAGFQRYLVKRDLPHWRNTLVLKLEPDDVTRITIDNAHGRFVFDKKAGWSDRNKNLLRAFEVVRAHDFAAAGAATGLTHTDKPATIQLDLASGDKRILRVGHISKNTDRYAMLEGHPTVYVLSQWVTTWVLANAETSRDR